LPQGCENSITAAKLVLTIVFTWKITTAEYYSRTAHAALGGIGELLADLKPLMFLAMVGG
jgi:hypothetical protein